MRNYIPEVCFEIFTWCMTQLTNKIKVNFGSSTLSFSKSCFRYTVEEMMFSMNFNSERDCKALHSVFSFWFSVFCLIIYYRTKRKHTKLLLFILEESLKRNRIWSKTRHLGTHIQKYWLSCDWFVIKKERECFSCYPFEFGLCYSIGFKCKLTTNGTLNKLNKRLSYIYSGVVFNIFNKS